MIFFLDFFCVCVCSFYIFQPIHLFLILLFVVGVAVVVVVVWLLWLLWSFCPHKHNIFFKFDGVFGSSLLVATLSITLFWCVDSQSTHKLYQHLRIQCVEAVYSFILSVNPLRLNFKRFFSTSLCH